MSEHVPERADREAIVTPNWQHRPWWAGTRDQCRIECLRAYWRKVDKSRCPRCGR